MKKRLVMLLLVLVLALISVSLAVAEDGSPVGGCPDGFELHMMMEHGHGEHGQHHHAGNSEDFNGDGYICGKHVSADGTVHVHIDNNVPLP
jgi:hypothetical protein